MIEAVVVDLGGVAARFHPERRLHRLAEDSGLTQQVVESRLFGSGLDERAERGELSPEALEAAILEALESRVSIEALVDAWALAFELDDAVLGRLDELRVRRVLFTNNGPMLNACVQRPLKRLTETFDAVICSWQLQARKPDARAFEAVSERLAVRPERLLLLDDTEANVEGARAQGWAAERVTSAGEVASALSRHLG